MVRLLAGARRECIVKRGKPRQSVHGRPPRLPCSYVRRSGPIHVLSNGWERPRGWTACWLGGKRNTVLPIPMECRRRRPRTAGSISTWPPCTQPDQPPLQDACRHRGQSSSLRSLEPGRPPRAPSRRPSPAVAIRGPVARPVPRQVGCQRGERVVRERLVLEQAVVARPRAAGAGAGRPESSGAARDRNGIAARSSLRSALTFMNGGGAEP
jgi:hypothetical protein